MLRFSSPMVNRENQELDTSSFRKYRTIDEMFRVTLQRVMHNQKPSGVVTFDEPVARKLHAQLKKEPHLVVAPLQRHKFLPGHYRIIVTHRGTLDDRFDMDALAAWYARNGLLGVAEDILEKRHKRLTSYFDDWDFADEYSIIDPWETGLFLGYPVENTMRRIYGVKRVKP